MNNARLIKEIQQQFSVMGDGTVADTYPYLR